MDNLGSLMVGAVFGIAVVAAMFGAVVGVIVAVVSGG